jgi:hypothetical protein
LRIVSTAALTLPALFERVQHDRRRAFGISDRHAAKADEDGRWSSVDEFTPLVWRLPVRCLGKPVAGERINLYPDP